MKKDYTKVEFWTTECDVEKVRFTVRIDDFQKRVEGLDIRKGDYLNNFRFLKIGSVNTKGTVIDVNNPIQHLMNTEDTLKILKYWTSFFDLFRSSYLTEQADEDMSEATEDA